MNGAMQLHSVIVTCFYKVKVNMSHQPDTGSHVAVRVTIMLQFFHALSQVTINISKYIRLNPHAV